MIISVLSANIALLAKHRGSLRIRSTVHKNQQDSYLSSCSIGSQPPWIASQCAQTSWIHLPSCFRLCRSHENHIWCLGFFGEHQVSSGTNPSDPIISPFDHLIGRSKFNCFPKQVWWGLIHGLYKPNSIATAQHIFALVYLELLLSDNLVNTH